jgi:hypothetical protein
VSKDDGWIERRLAAAKSDHSLPDSTAARMRDFLQDEACGRVLRPSELVRIVDELMATMIGSALPPPEKPHEN